MPTEKWTVQKFVELLRKHDAGTVKAMVISQSERKDGRWHVNGWLNLESLVAELNGETKP